MTDGDDTLPIADPDELDTDVLGESYDDLLDDGEPPTLEDWKAVDVEDSDLAKLNQLVNGGPLEDFDRFILTAILVVLQREPAAPSCIARDRRREQQPRHRRDREPIALVPEEK